MEMLHCVIAALLRERHTNGLRPRLTVVCSFVRSPSGAHVITVIHGYKLLQTGCSFADQPNTLRGQEAMIPWESEVEQGDATRQLTYEPKAPVKEAV